jgi:hypothetical protein
MNAVAIAATHPTPVGSTLRKMSRPRLSTFRVIPIMVGRKQSSMSPAIKPTQKTPLWALVFLSFHVSRSCELHRRVAGTVIDAMAAA